jgi:hypothetical protein
MPFCSLPGEFFIKPNAIPNRIDAGAGYPADRANRG